MQPPTSHTCPSIENLDRYAQGHVDDDVEQHITNCSWCHSQVQALETQDLSFEDDEPEPQPEPIDVTTLPDEIFTHPDTLLRQLEATAERTPLTLVA